MYQADDLIVVILLTNTALWCLFDISTHPPHPASLSQKPKRPQTIFTLPNHRAFPWPAVMLLRARTMLSGMFCGWLNGLKANAYASPTSQIVLGPDQFAARDSSLGLPSSIYLPYTLSSRRLDGAIYMPHTTYPKRQSPRNAARIIRCDACCVAQFCAAELSTSILRGSLFGTVFRATVNTLCIRRRRGDRSRFRLRFVSFKRCVNEERRFIQTEATCEARSDCALCVAENNVQSFLLYDQINEQLVGLLFFVSKWEGMRCGLARRLRGACVMNAR